MATLRDFVGKLDEGICQVQQAFPDMPSDESLTVRMLLLLGNHLQDEFERKLKPHKLSDSDFHTLLILFSSPDGSSTPSELCEYTSQGPTNMTRIANALVQRKLIARGASAADRRRVLLSITPEGRRFVKKLLPELFPAIVEIFADFSPAEMRTLGRLLRKLADGLDRLDRLKADATP